MTFPTAEKGMTEMTKKGMVAHTHTHRYVQLYNLGNKTLYHLTVLNCTRAGGSGGVGAQDIFVRSPSRANFMATYVPRFQDGSCKHLPR